MTVAAWIHFSLFWIILPTNITILKVYTLGGLMNSSAKMRLLFSQKDFIGLGCRVCFFASGRRPAALRYEVESWAE